MQVQVRLIGAFCERGACNELNLDFTCAPTLRELTDRALNCLGEKGRTLDRSYMILALDGRVVQEDSWDKTPVQDGQVCSLFPLLQGG